MRKVLERRRAIEKRNGIQLLSPGSRGIEAPALLRISIDDGIAIIGSDAHYWPDQVSTAHRAFVHLCSTLNPAAVIVNGDEFDGATISRHPPIGWENRPTVVEELDAVKARLAEIENASLVAKHRIWCLGNHDARYETRLATVAPEYAKNFGFHLKDHFHAWAPTWGVIINEHTNHPTVVKHRFKGGVHATYNNTLHSGVNMITGHLHSLKVTPHTDYRGTRWGVDCGMMAPVYGAQFTDYMEENPRSWRSGFAVLTFWNGQLLDPELVRVLDEEKGLVVFRGKVIEV